MNRMARFMDVDVFLKGEDASEPSLLEDLDALKEALELDVCMFFSTGDDIDCEIADILTQVTKELDIIIRNHKGAV